MFPLRQLAMTAILGCVVSTVSVDAQTQGRISDVSASTPRTHVVRAGDTLWDLARTYLGDPHRWQVLYRLNWGVVLNPHWLEPGMVLRLTAAEVPLAAAMTESDQAPTGATVTDLRVVGQAPLPETPAHPAASRPGPDASRLTREYARPTAVRAGDFLTSPFVVPIGGPPGAGRIERAIGETLGATTSRLRSVQFRDVVRIALPMGGAGAVGEQFLVIRMSDVLGPDAQVAVPVGVLTITAAAANGMADAELTRKFDDVTADLAVIPLETLAMPVGVLPTATQTGRETRVRWIAGNALVSVPGQYLVVEAGSADGLVPGDQLTVRDAANGDAELAVVQVTRVTPRGATAIVRTVRNGGVSVGARARVSAKMP